MFDSHFLVHSTSRLSPSNCPPHYFCQIANPEAVVKAAYVQLKPDAPLSPMIDVPNVDAEGLLRVVSSYDHPV